MANTYYLIEAKTLSTGTNSISFTSIPQTYTDLNLLISVRADTAAELYLTINGGTSGYRTLNMNGSAPSTFNFGLYQTAVAYLGEAEYSTMTANTFASASVYLPKYTTSTKKTLQTESGQASNSGASLYWYINGSIYNSTSAIDNLQVKISSGNMVAGSTFYLYGIKNS